MKADRMKMKIPFILFVMLLPGFVFSQNTGSSPAANTSQTATDIPANAQLAISSPDYRVTAGDIYTLTFMAGAQPVTYTIIVDNTYRIRVANMGIVDAAGKTYSQLKAQVETIVSNNYSMSGVQFVLTSPSSFLVYVQGEVKQARMISAWALTRLSSLVNENDLTDQASWRDVQIRSANGQTRTYDLFKATRLGNLSHDPYLRPGDVVIFNRIDRAIFLNGAVERPGIYQLLQGENLKELIELYGSGFTPIADKTRLELVRWVNSQSISGDIIFLKETDVNDNYALENYDSITVPMKYPNSSR